MRRAIYASMVFLLAITALAAINQRPISVFNDNQEDSEQDTPTYQTPVQRPRIYGAYSTNMELRIPIESIEDVLEKARTAGCNVTYQDYMFEWKPGLGTIHVGASVRLGYDQAILLKFDRYANITHVHINWPYNAGEISEALWGRLSAYMHEDVTRLNGTATDIERGYSSIDFTVPGEPDWELVRSDMGNLVEKHSRWLGRVFEIYDSDSFINTMTGFHIITSETSHKLGASQMRVILSTSMDDEGDAKLEIYESVLMKLTNQAELFEPMFKTLGFQTDVLSQIKFDESFALSYLGQHP